MAKSIAVAVRNGQADYYGDQLDSGFIRIYSGTPPATADAALSGNTLLAECTFAASAFGAAASGTVTAGSITSDASANNSGTASFYRTFKSDGTTVVEQGTVGTSSADMIVPSTTVTSGVAFGITSFTHTVP